MIIVQTSRGYSPARVIQKTVDLAVRASCPHFLVSGLPADKAKQQGVNIALKKKQDLFLIEDDILIDDKLFLAMANSKTVSIGWTYLKDGQPNYTLHKEEVIHAGTACLMIPYEILSKLEQPVFKFHTVNIKRGKLILGEENDSRGAEAYFFYKLQEAKIPSKIMGKVTHVLPENHGEVSEYNNPTKFFFL
jgi:hypothetical protein